MIYIQKKENVRNIYVKDFFLRECKTLKGIFLKLKYPKKLIESAINSAQHPRDLNHTPTDIPPSDYLAYKDQKSADQLWRQLCDLGRKINHPLQPIFTNKTIIDDLRETELKPTLVNQQNVVYKFKCDLCDANYIGYTCRHLHQRVEEQKHSVKCVHI